MKRLARLIIAVAFPALLVAAASCFFFSLPARASETVAITDLIQNMKEYDGQEVTIQGEAIGDLMVRGPYAWITVNDDAYSKKSIEEGGELVGMSNAGIGVWIPTSETSGIRVLGGYKNKGDIVLLTGTFNRACREHGGDTDIHATRLEVTSPGYAFRKGFQYGRLMVIIILSAAIAFLWDVLRTKRKKALQNG